MPLPIPTPPAWQNRSHMGSEMAAKDKSAPDGELEKDIKSFAAKIGFAVPGHAFGHDEFDADKAGEAVGGQQLGEQPAGKPNKRGAPEKSKAAKTKKRKGGKKPQGVQPRQESRTFKSLLGPEEPAVWFEAADRLPKLHKAAESVDDDEEDATDEQIELKKSTAEAQLKREKAAFEKRMKQDYRDSAYLQKVKIAGTSADRIAALTLLIRESALANVHELEPLLAFMEKRTGSRELVARSMEALSELFKMYLLPERKLRFFEQQPIHLLSEDEEGAKHALYWFVEDTVKRAYGRFVAALEAATCDPLDFLRERSTSIAAHLLGEKPEQEARLLTMIITRLGDRLKKISSKVVLYISVLLKQHPHWKEVITREVERFTLMPNNTMRVVHYATAALNQMAFNSRNETDKAVARRLVDLYFTLFKMILDGHIGFRKDMERKAEMKSKGKKFHKKKFAKKLGKRKHRDGRLNKDATSQPRIEELDARILNNLIIGVRRAIVFVPWKERDRLVEQHLDNLFKIVHLAPIGVGIQALTLLFHVLAEKSTSGDRLYRALYARLLAPSLLGSSKLPLMISTIFRAMKGDSSLARMTAFAKRLLQIGIPGQAEAASGIILLLSELMKTHQGLKAVISQPEDHGDIEVFDDVSVDGGGRQKRNPAKGAQKNGAKGSNDTTMKYEIGEREPLYCNAEGACLWELAAYASHVHPTVSEMARSLMSLQPVEFIGDPLQDLGLVTFLDKFYGKEARSHAEGAVFRPMGGVTQSVVMKRVGSEAFGNQEEQDVGKEDLFFHKYYTLKSVRGHRKEMAERRRSKRGEKRAREDNEHQQGEDMFTDDDDDDADLEELEAEMSDPDVETLVAPKKTRNGKSQHSEDDAEYDYDDLGAAMEAEGLSDSDGGFDLIMDGEGVDSGDDDDEPHSNGQAAADDDDDDVEDVILPSSEFPEDWSEGEDERPKSKRRKSNLEKGGNKKSIQKRRRRGGNVFAPAEEYAHMLQE